LYKRTKQYFPNGNLGDHNYCRNPDKSKSTIWCYTSSSSNPVDECEPKAPTTPAAAAAAAASSGKTALDIGDETCSDPPKCTKYKGKQNISRYGHTCRKWTGAVATHYKRTPTDLPGKGLGDHNYCRNPTDESSGLWCYTESGDVMEPCDPIKPNPTKLEKCSGINCSGYRGRQTKAKSGDLCKAWTEQIATIFKFTKEIYPNADLGSHNYCRNPDYNQRGIWCFTENPSNPIQACDPILDTDEIGDEVCSGVKCDLYRGT
jgi:integrin beta 3